jgi:glycosyltransferase involved in cell wall biosynthesis
MRLLYLIPSLNPAAGGPVENLRHCAAVMSEMGHSTEVATLDKPESRWVHEFPFPATGLGPAIGSYAYTPRLVPWLKKNASDHDVVIVRGIWQYHSFACWRTLRRSTTPYVVFTHGMLDPWFKSTYPWKHAKKWMYWPWADYRVLRDAKAVLFTCEEERLLARRSFFLYRCNEQVVSYGTATSTQAPDLCKAAFFERHPELKGKRFLLFMGRIHPKKGCDLLIEAFASVCQDDPECCLVIAGPDQIGMQSQLLALARRTQVADRISWTGMISGNVKQGAIEAAEAFILPSHQENFGIVVAEALASGKPVLISDKVNIWREIEQDGAGLVANDDLDGTRWLLRTWFGMSVADKQAMSARARQSFLKRFEIRKSAQSMIDVLLPFVNGTTAPLTLNAHDDRSRYSGIPRLFTFE